MVLKAIGAYYTFYLVRIAKSMVKYVDLKQMWDFPRGLPFSTYTPRVGGWGQTSYTFPLRITCKKGVDGSR